MSRPRFSSGVTMGAFAAIRRADGKTYIDVLTIAALAELARDKAEATDRHMPAWAKDNPIVRISRIEIKERQFHDETTVLE